MMEGEDLDWLDIIKAQNVLAQETRTEVLTDKMLRVLIEISGAENCYLIEKEQELPEGERMDFVSIVTPNHLHFPVCRAFIERGFHVVCDKPVTTTLEDAEALCRLAIAKSQSVYGAKFGLVRWWERVHQVPLTRLQHLVRWA